MAGYYVSVCDLCRTQSGDMFRITVPLTLDPHTGARRRGDRGDYNVEVCLRCLQTRFISRLIEAAIAAMDQLHHDAEPRIPGDCTLRPG